MQKEYIEKNHLVNQLEKEVFIQSTLNHKNILNCFGSFEDKDYYYLILEIAPHGDLFSLMKRQQNKRFDEKISACFVKQVCEALICIHDAGFMHRDLKPENLLLSFVFRLK